MALDANILESVNQWMGAEYDVETRARVSALLNSGDEKAIIDAFYKKLAFGTGGLRGIMGDGPNRMNRYTVAAATQGFADYMLSVYGNKPISVAIAFDSRNNSSYFAEITASVFAANGIKVYLYNALRPTPQLSFTIRHLGCAGGVVVTASHNPKEYNGYKAYWKDGGQLVEPHDRKVMEFVNKIEHVSQIKMSGNESLITRLGEEMDEAYRAALLLLSMDNGFVKRQQDLPIVYSPIHGTGITEIPAMLKQWGFNNVQVVEEQAVPNGNFPTVVYPNPEEKEAMRLSLEKAAALNADIALASDPDSDRVGVAVKDSSGEYILLNGNQIGSLIVHYVLKRHAEDNKFKGNEFVVRTIVSTALIDEIAASFNVNVYHTLTGFKYIGELITQLEGKEIFLAGGEESYGYLIGSPGRDKDAVISCAILAEMTAYYKDKSLTLFDALLEIYSQYGLYKEKLHSITLKGKDGQEQILAMMNSLRSAPPTHLGKAKVVEIRDYELAVAHHLSDNTTTALSLPKSDVLQFITEDGSVVSVRPSGTEPKIKFYCSTKGDYSRTEDFDAQIATLDIKINLLIDSLLDCTKTV